MRDAATITSELVASGLSPTQTALLMELVLSMSTGLSGANPVESPGYRAAENRRAWDRERQKRRREAEREAKLASAPSTGPRVESTGQSGGNADVCPTVEDKEKGLSVKKENKKGSRLLSGTRASNEQKLIAIENGCPPDRVDAVWTEFVDYWSDIPGHKGCKLSWTGTWRNRVKSLFERTSNGSRTFNPERRSASSDFFAGMRSVAADLAGDDQSSGPAAEEVPLGRVNIEH